MPGKQPASTTSAVARSGCEVLSGSSCPLAQLRNLRSITWGVDQSCWPQNDQETLSPCGSSPSLWRFPWQPHAKHPFPPCLKRLRPFFRQVPGLRQHPGSHWPWMPGRAPPESRRMQNGLLVFCWLSVGFLLVCWFVCPILPQNGLFVWNVFFVVASAEKGLGPV